MQPRTTRSLITHLGAAVLGLILGYQIPGVIATYRLSENIKQIERQIEQDPSDPNNWFSLGSFKQRAGDDGGALAAYEKSLKLDPLYLQTYWALADYYLQRGDQVKAEKWSMDALELAKKHYPAEVRESELFLKFVQQKREAPSNPTKPSTGPSSR